MYDLACDCILYVQELSFEKCSVGTCKCDLVVIDRSVCVYCVYAVIFETVFCVLICVY